MTDSPVEGTSRVRAVFLGSGGFAVPALQALAGHHAVELVAAITAPPRAAGRGGTLTSTPVDDAATALAVPVLRPERLRAPDALAAVGALRPGLAVLADYGQIVPAPLLELEHGALNLHPSLLPRHRGASPVPAAILAGDAETGVTLMRMDAGLDSGPIVAQVRYTMDGTETRPGLEARLAGIAAELLATRLDAWLEGRALPRPQDEAAVTMTRPLRRDDGRLDPDRTAVELERQVRAYDPWPGTFVETPQGRLKVWRAAVLPPLPGQEARTITVDDTDGIAMTTPDGRLQLLEVQAPGGRRMSGAEFLRGLRGRGITGMVLSRSS